MDSKIKKCCPKCCQYYHFKSSGAKPEDSNIPLFLSCGHSMCEKCIATIIKCEEFIKCPICGQDIHISGTDHAVLVNKLSSKLNKHFLYKLFPVNHNMLGELMLHCIEPISGKNHNDDEYFLNITELIKINESEQGKCVECHEETSKMCKQCGIIVCRNCFIKSHKNFIIFKNHALQNIEFQSEDALCATHKTKSLDYYCTNCAKAICMDCLMVGGEKSCKNHDVTSIQEVNEEMLVELSEMTPKVDETFRRLTKTAVDIGHTLMRLDNENSVSSFTKLLNQVEQHYSKLNAAIQKQKKEIIDSIMDMKLTEIESLNEAKYSVAESIQKAKHTLNTINSIDTNKLNEVNMSAILKDAKEVVNTPWYLNREEGDTHLKLKINEDILPIVNNYVQLEGKANTTYSLCTTQELNDRHEDIPAAPSTVVYPPEIVRDVRQLNKVKAEKEKENIKPTSFIKNVPQYRSKLGSCSSLNSIASDSSHKSYQSYDQRPTVSPFPESQHPKQILEGSQELIYISHIVDPHNFYVQRACHQSNVKELLRGFRNAVSMPKPSLSHVAEGKVYLVLNKADNLWQRCRIMTIDRQNLNKPLYRVFCIDFGSTEIVTIDKLRLLPPALIQSPPPFAINCCLANCEPINGSWTSDDSLLIQNIIDNKQAVLHVRRVRSSTAGTMTLECDVSTVAHGLSVAHALAFHGRARVSSTVKYPNMIGIVEKPKIFISNTDFKLNSVEEVYITHIVSPDHFYVRKEHLQSVYEKLCEDLDQEYSSNSHADSIYLPEKDMSCSVQHGRWSRALVRSLPGRGRVSVLLCDTGELQLVHWSALRRLHPRFTTLRALATECHLAGVTPLNKVWSPSSVALLQKFEDKLLELHVEDDRNRNSLGVTLYDKSDEDNVLCVNTQMIKYKFAVTFGLFIFNKNSEMDDLVITNKSPLDEPKPPEKKSITILKKEELKTEKPKEEDLEAKDKGPLRLEAKILKYQSPSLLYVSLVHQQKIFNDLFEKIQKYYSKKKTQGKHVWNVGDRCCTLCCQSQTWRRAAILEVNDGEAKVFYSDFACVETIPLANLKELAEDFASIGDAAIMCHMCGVIPAVGEEWPSLTKEYLNELLDAYKRVFITKLGKFKGKSMPVELWVYHTTQGGALEPNTSEWRCLNKKIIEQGLGIPDKSEESTGESTSTSGDDMLSFLNITGSVRDWLQIEPMPLKPLQIKSDSDSHSCSSAPGETDADRTEEDVPNSKTIFISDWMPPEPLPTTEFTAMPTYIDNDGVVYLHDMAQEDTLHLIQKALDVRFKNPDPKAKFVKWSVGEPCVTLYFLDNRFYRGKILAVNNEESNCLVHYIDYGNDELCAFENLRKSIALYQIPTQAHKCILNRIEPLAKKWDRTTLDYIHRSIVEKQCFVKVSGELIGDLIPIELNYDKLCINDHLVEFEMARYSDGSEVVVRKFAPNDDVKKKLELTIDTDSGPDYIVEYDPADTSISQDSVPISSLEGKDWNELIELDENNIDGIFITYTPYTETEFECTITVLNELNKLELNILHNEEITKMYEDMYEELQTDCSDMTPLNGIFENKACIALFPEDGRWYRASILEHSKTTNRIKVKYVDYGNIKVLSLFDVKEITDKYTQLEPCNVTATIYGVSLNPEVNKDTLTERYEQTFLDKEPFQAKVIEINGSVPSVELSQGGKLIYEDLILENIFLSHK